MNSTFSKVSLKWLWKKNVYPVLFVRTCVENQTGLKVELNSGRHGYGENPREKDDMVKQVGYIYGWVSMGIDKDERIWERLTPIIYVRRLKLE